MSLLGTMVDKTRVTFAAVTVGNELFQAIAHSVSSPDFIDIAPVSIAAASCSPVVFGLGWNGSRATIGLAVATLNAAASPTVAVDAVVWQVFSAIR